MKKYIIFIIIGIIVLISIFVLLEMRNKKKVSIKDIKRMHFSYSQGYAANAYIIYEIEYKDNKYIAKIKPYGVSDEEATEKEVDKCFVKNVKEVLDKYEVSKWNGFNKTDRNVLDGDSFSFSVTTIDDKSISAHGYMSWPKNYRDVRSELDTLFNNLIENEVEDLKPIIYLYPTKEMDVSVKLGHKDKLTVSYPEYNDGWEVKAYPSGKLIDKSTNRELYSLFWEGYNTLNNSIKDEGFIVEGKDASKFLEEKLKVLGLNDREAEEFIIYWLPKLQNNKYNYIRFETKEEQDENMPLIINPKPDSIIRINMEFKAIDKKIEIKEQKLITPKRTGFTVVEWGGTILQ